MVPMMWTRRHRCLPEDHLLTTFDEVQPRPFPGFTPGMIVLIVYVLAVTAVLLYCGLCRPQMQPSEFTN